MKTLKQVLILINKTIEELNKRLKENPHYSLPDGYTKIIEKDITYEYILPNYFNIPESK